MRSIREFLLYGLLAVLTAAGLLSYALSRSAAHHEVSEVFDAELAQYARLVDELMQQSWMQMADGGSRGKGPVAWPVEAESFGNERSTLGHGYERKMMVQLWSVDRRLLLRTANAPEQAISAFAPGYALAQLSGQRWQVFVLHSKLNGRWIIVGQRDDIRNEVTGELAQAVLLPWLLTLPALLLLAALLIGRAMRPLLQLSTQLQQRDMRALEPIQLAETPREIQPVTHALNALLHNIATGIEREQRLTADAAHELRTPLTVLTLYARNALEASSDVERQQALHKLEAGLLRSRRLLDQLLTYARVNGPLTGEAEFGAPQDLAALCRRAIAELYPLLQQRQQEISLHEEGTVHIRAQSLLLETLICNLLDNASRYSPPGSTLEVRLIGAQGKQGPVLEIHDSGPGIAPADRERALQPFQRLHSGDAQGAGLGLAIVSAIARWHDGHIELDSSALGGLCVRVVFPPPA